MAQSDDVGVPVNDAAVDVNADAAGLGVPVGGHSGDRGVLGRPLTRGNGKCVMTEGPPVVLCSTTLSIYYREIDHHVVSATTPHECAIRRK